MRVFALRLKSHKVDSVDNSNLQFGEVLAQNIDGRKGLEGWDVSGTRHHYIRLASLVRAGPVPDTNPLRTMFDRCFHIEILQRRLFAGDDHIDVVAAAQTVISHREQGVGIGRKINSDDLGFLVHDMINETWILMAETIVILPPNMGSQQIVERCDGPAPGNVARNF